ncbi:MAG TPA: DEAD/DEAH box helicase [Candidatus Kapabacteria bacterium]|nr:DEAD/DEAH box helicase [Candidatus Kapabacteria bacterium]HPO63033.1 DEAD/DEAH box helicase [Candidatus Kapabacteria bacterium]
MLKYGLTWWGQKWLDSLTHIDYSNRLPRGSAYASRGSVKSIEFTINIIRAKVQGSQPKPYNVKIVIPPFTLNEKKILTDLIVSNNIILSKLLNRELPQELYELALQKKIMIFPTSWRSFQMDCSCPDSAVPCKHIAAVIYLIANEIDKNPFLVFQLHDFDIFNELEKRKISISSQAQETITQVYDIFTEKELDKGNTFDKEIFEKIDFTSIPNIREDLLSMLTPNPIFYQKDFKDIVDKMYKQSAKYLNNKDFKINDNYFISFDSNINILFNKDYTIEKIQISSNGDSKEFIHIRQLIGYLDAIEFKNITNYQEDVISLYLIFLFSKVLALSSAFIPQLINTPQDTYQIRWVPATINENVKNILELITSISPGGICCLTSKVKQNEVKHFQTIYEQTITLCSLFIANYIFESFPVKNLPFYYECKNILTLFFCNTPVRFDSFSEQQLPNTIQLWLNKYYISYKEYAPIIKVEDDIENTFNINILVENRKDSLTEPIEFHKFINNEKYNNDKFSVLKDLTQLSSHFTDLTKIINSSKKTSITYATNEFVEVLFKVLPVLKLFGLKILLPKALQQLVKPKLSLKLKKKGQKSITSFLNLDTLLDFDWQIAIGDENISIEDFKELVKKMSNLLKFKDQYIYIENSELEKLFKALNNPPSLNSKELLKVALSREYEDGKVFLTKDVIDDIEQLTKISQIEKPNGLNAELRHYQETGYEWLYKNSQLGFGSLIADDMGLGKTIQVIATLLKFKEEGKFQNKKSLAIVPTTLLTNWEKEIQRFAPDLKAFIYHGNKRELPQDDFDLILTTYGTIRNDIDIIKKLHLHTLIIDEAQNIKNPDTEQTKAVKQVKADIKIAMSGTPVENRLSEYWSIFDFVNKGYLGSLKKFSDEFVTPIQQYRDMHKLEKFKKITQPFILRRLKSDKSIIKDLPDKIENNQYCSLTKEQTAIYEKTVKNTLKSVTDAEGIERKGLVLKLMTALKQICNHPNQYLKKPNPDPNTSGKMMLLLSILENILDNNEKTLIFTQYKEMGDLLAEVIEKNFSSIPLFLHGGTTRKQRDELVNKFQEGKSNKIFILSLKAGGTGLNLTAASNVIHYDLWWNPAVEAQATDRAYRIGQQSNVMVYRLLTKGTLEEKIDLMLNSKKELANLTVVSGEKWIGELSNKELKELVSLS